MTDNELLKQVRERAKGTEFSERWCILELAKRYEMAKAEIEMLKNGARKGITIGTVKYFLDNEPSGREQQEAENEVIKELCDGVKKIAQKYPEQFFIRKRTEDLSMHPVICSVGAKLTFPTVVVFEHEEFL